MRGTPIKNRDLLWFESRRYSAYYAIIFFERKAIILLSRSSLFSKTRRFIAFFLSMLQIIKWNSFFRAEDNPVHILPLF